MASIGASGAPKPQEESLTFFKSKFLASRANEELVIHPTLSVGERVSLASYWKNAHTLLSMMWQTFWPSKRGKRALYRFTHYNNTSGWYAILKYNKPPGALKGPILWSPPKADSPSWTDDEDLGSSTEDYIDEIEKELGFPSFDSFSSSDGDSAGFY